MTTEEIIKRLEEAQEEVIDGAGGASGKIAELIDDLKCSLNAVATYIGDKMPPREILERVK